MNCDGCDVHYMERYDDTLSLFPQKLAERYDNAVSVNLQSIQTI
jgi:hypothetical protein